MRTVPLDPLCNLSPTRHSALSSPIEAVSRPRGVFLCEFPISAQAGLSGACSRKDAKRRWQFDELSGIIMPDEAIPQGAFRCPLQPPTGRLCRPPAYWRNLQPSAVLSEDENRLSQCRWEGRESRGEVLPCPPSVMMNAVKDPAVGRSERCRPGIPPFNTSPPPSPSNWDCRTRSRLPSSPAPIP